MRDSGSEHVKRGCCVAPPREAVLQWAEDAALAKGALKAADWKRFR